MPTPPESGYRSGDRLQGRPDGQSGPTSELPPAEPRAGSTRLAGLQALLAEVGQLGRAIKELFGAQLQLLAAEFGLARRAISWIFVAGLAATIVGVGLGLTSLALVGLLLAKWFGSWLWALLALGLLQVLMLVATVLFFRRCLHWMTLPVTRGQWSAMMHDTMSRARRQARRTPNENTGEAEHGPV